MKKKKQITDEIIISMNSYLECIRSIQNNYGVPESNKQIFLNGQLEILYNIIKTDKNTIFEQSNPHKK